MNSFTDDSILSVIKGVERKQKSYIMVLGVGGAGGNAVNHMYDLGIKGVSFMICNTDRQALDNSPIDTKIQLGEGLGAGNDPKRGKQAALETLDEIMIRLEEEGIKMLFITAGMGGGTGTGAAPVIAKAARNKGILTVGIVTLPFFIEGKVRENQARQGLEELQQHVDSLVAIRNDNIQKIYGSLPIKEAFGKADDILATAAKGIAELITRHGIVNVDFADVKTVMQNSGMALMGSAKATGSDKITQVVEQALSSPLLNHQDIRGAKNILFNLSYSSGDLVSFDQAQEALNLIQKRASKSFDGNDANIIWGAGEQTDLDDEIELTIIATGFDLADATVPGAIGKQPQPDTNSGFTPTKQPTTPKLDIKRPPVEATVLKLRHKDRFDDIDKCSARPSYTTRGMHLLGGGKQGKVVFQPQEPEREEPKAPQNGGTLFG